LPTTQQLRQRLGLLIWAWIFLHACWQKKVDTLTCKTEMRRYTPAYQLDTTFSTTSCSHADELS
jgi:hypothetical protein